MDEPMVNHLGVRPSPQVTKDVLMESLVQGSSLMVTRSSTQEILGVGANGTIGMHESTPNVPDPEFKRILRALDDLYVKAEEIHGDIFRLFETSIFFEISHLCVAKEMRGKGLCRHIIQETLQLAKGLGYKAAIVEATADHSRRALLKQGFKVLSEINYDEYTQDGIHLFKGLPQKKFSLLGASLLT
eukprot:TRINITY_DN2579_c0_g1_i4.p1 TRINITY_DN2579_c0_g1~~TRINITY_DN2579_c0_g1_i4.p1  ORF type:complete len:187 (-),score=37.48 TRINITY_DN2579_c0_g1_i4:157-717(-)